MEERMKASQFKAECLRVMDRVQKTRRRIVITKRNIPIAQLVPIDPKEEKFWGKLKGTIHYIEDLLPPIEETWDADS